MANEWIAKDYDGAAVATTLNGAVSGAATTLVVTSGSGLPDGSIAPFVIALDRLGTEEKVLIASRTGNTLTVTERGYDGTAAVAHADLVTVEHVLDAHSMQQVNALANAMTTAGDMFYKGSGMSFTRLAIGANNCFIVVAGGVPTMMVKADVQDLIFTSAAGSGLVYAANSLAVNPDGSTLEISGDAVRVKDAGITADKLAAAVAGAGLTGGAGTALSVVVDNSTLECPVDTVQVKDGGITDAKLLDGTFASITGLGTQTEDLTVSKAAATLTLTGTGNPGIELRSTNAGTPTIDFSNDGAIDYDARMILSSDDLLTVLGAVLRGSAGFQTDYCGRATASATIALNNGSATVITLAGTEGYDYAGWHSTSSNTARVTCATVAGVVHFDGYVPIDASSSGDRLLQLLRYNSGGTVQEIICESSVSAGDTSGYRNALNVSGDTLMVAGDYVQMEVTVNTAGLNTIYSLGVAPSLSWHLVRAT